MSITTIKHYSAFSLNLKSIGIGYAIGISLCFLFLFSTIILTSYICCRRRRADQHRIIYLPTIIFVDDENDESQNDVVVGLDQAVINSYPKFVFSNRKGLNDVVCPICLCEYRESEMMRMLPDCRHCFHVMCVDAWLKLNASCPICRNSPLTTPLQEVVPLSQSHYSDGGRRQ